MPGFQIVVARDDGRVVGTGHGVTLPADVPWWRAVRAGAPGAVRQAAETGGVFWLRELMVRASYRARGLGRTLHDQLCAAREEEHVTMTVIVDNEPASSAYLRWGYTVYGQVRHAPTSPLYDALWRPPTDRRPQNRHL